MTKFADFLEEELKDPKVKSAYDDLEGEFAIIQALIDERKKCSLTQKQLAERTGIRQGDISKLENGNANPSLKTLLRLAKGLGKRLTIGFEPVY